MVLLLLPRLPRQSRLVLEEALGFRVAVLRELERSSTALGPSPGLWGLDAELDQKSKSPSLQGRQRFSTELRCKGDLCRPLLR